MSQTVGDILGRAVWEVDDEFYTQLKQPELISGLDRVYREFCRTTRGFTRSLQFQADGTNEIYLYGTVSDGTQFGDDVVQYYWMQYAGAGVSSGLNTSNMQEVDLATILQLRINSDPNDTICSNQDDPIFFAIKYDGKYNKIYFAFNTTAGDTISFKYYVIPRIGTLTEMTDTFGIDDKYTDDLIPGLRALSLKRLVNLAMKNNAMDKVKYYAEQLKVASAEWAEILLRDGREIADWRLESTTSIMIVGSPFLDQDDFYDIDYSIFPV